MKDKEWLVLDLLGKALTTKKTLLAAMEYVMQQGIRDISTIRCI